MKKFLAILMALVMTMAFSTAWAGEGWGDMTSDQLIGDDECYRTAAINVTIVNGDDGDENYREIEVNWIDATDGAATITKRQVYEWDPTNHEYLETMKWEIVSAEFTLAPAFFVEVTNHSSPGNDFNVSFAGSSDEMSTWGVYTGENTLAAQATAAGTSLLSSALDSTTRTTSFEADFDDYMDDDALFAWAEDELDTNEHFAGTSPGVHNAWFILGLDVNIEDAD